MKYFFLCLFIVFIVPNANARPVSYPTGWTLMTMNDKDANSSHIHYSPTAKYSVGLRHDYYREPSKHADTVQLNYLVKRWNKPQEQANIYLKTGAGIAYNSDDTDPAGFIGLATDWETRRYFTSYENKFYHGGDDNKFIKHSARVGVAPYIGDFGDLHTWLMLQTDYDAGDKDSFAVTPLVRFFKGPVLLEAGYNLDDGILFNYVQRF